MTIEQSKVVDVVSVNPATNEVVLSISDHLEWTDDDHLFLLQEKLNNYLAFIESGEILLAYPSAKGRTVVLDLACKHAPNSAGKAFLERAASVVKSAGFLFTYRVLPQE